MIWQDILITIASLIFSIALIPQVLYGFKKKKGFVTIKTSGPTFIGLYIMSLAFFTLSLYISSIITFVTGSLWFILFLQRLFYVKV